MAQNAVRHGLAGQFRVLPFESQEEFDRFQPAGELVPQAGLPRFDDRDGHGDRLLRGRCLSGIRRGMEIAISGGKVKVNTSKISKRDKWDPSQQVKA